jgi:hypothetical protein
MIKLIFQVIQSRDGGVNILIILNKFFTMAKKQILVQEYCFVICRSLASSAGKQIYLVDKYRIPAMIYSPGYITKALPNLVSQIDIMPPVLVYSTFVSIEIFWSRCITTRL